MFRFGPGGFGVFPLVGGILGLVLFALMIGSAIWLIVSFSRPGRWSRGFPGPGYAPPPYRSPALEELDLAYARGQVTREEYFRRRADLTGWAPPGGPPGFSAPGGSAPGPEPAAPQTP